MEKRVLLVDDEPMVLTALKRTLRQHKIIAETAPDGETALAMMEESPAPLILSDYRMPGMSGTELLAKIEARWPNTVRMIISGHSDLETVLAAIQTGVVHKFLAKPWSNDELVIQVLTAFAQAPVFSQHQETFARSHDEQILSEEQGELQRSTLTTDLQTKDAQLKAMLDTVQDGMVTISRRGIILSLNPALERIFGYRAADLLDQNVSMLMPGPYREKHDGFLDAYRPPGQKGIVGSLRRLVGLRKNGEVFPIELSVNEMTVEGESQFLGVIRDISDTVKAERENQLLHEALDRCHDGFALFAPGGRLVRCNEQFQQLYASCPLRPEEGVTYEAFFQACLDNGLLTDIDDSAVQQFGAFGDFTEDREFEIELDGKYWLEIRETRTESGGVIAFHLDVTEKKRAERSLQKAVLEAKNATKAKSQFLAMMSHEIRTPLNGVLGLLQLLQESPLDEKQRSYLDTALSSGKSLLTIISDILDFSKIEADRMELSEDNCDLPRLIKDIAQLFEARLAEKDLRLRLDIAHDLPPSVLVDSQRLRQVLSNLVSNAVKFTDRGEVAISLRPTPHGKICFEVCDTGIGIPEEEKHKLFTEFSTLKNNLKRTHEGTGLGLTISQRLITLMGGRLQVESEEHRGSRFWFELALPPAPSAPEPIGSATTEPQQFSGNILLVEDGETNRLVVKAMLESVGIGVTCAEDGETALTLCQAQRFDLVLMDISLPGMNGLETTQVIKAQPGRDKMPVIALTAYAMPGDRERFLAEGMDAYLEKPVDKQKLLAGISGFLSAAQTSQTQANEAMPEIAVDIDKLHQLAHDTSYEMVPELAGIFLNDAGKRLAEIEAFLTAGTDAEETRETVQRHLHTLGSSAALYGLALVHQSARTLEQRCADEFVAVTEALPAFLQLCQESLQQLDRVLIDFHDRRSDDAH